MVVQRIVLVTEMAIAIAVESFLYFRLKNHIKPMTMKLHPNSFELSIQIESLQ